MNNLSLPSLLTTLVLVVGSWTSVTLAEWELAAEGSDVVIDVGEARALDVAGIRGTLVFREHAAGEVRYAARTLDDRREPYPIALWADGDRLFLTTVEESEARILVEVGVPSTVDLFLDLEDSRVTISGIASEASLTGSGLEVLASAAKAPLEFDLVDSSVKVKSAGDDVTVEGQGLEVVLEGVAGDAYLTLLDSTVDVKYGSGLLEADLEETKMSVEALEGFLQVQATGGSVAVSRSVGGAELVLEGAQSTYQATKGPFQVETDSALAFKQHEGSFGIVGFGAGIRGFDCNGPLAIETDGAEVVLETLKGATVVLGQNLTVNVKGVEAELVVRTSYSSVLVEDSKAPVIIENEFGDVEIRSPSARLQVTTRDGNVRVSEASAPIELKADGDEVDVSWTRMIANEESTIENERGNVRVGLPLSSQARIDAAAPYGQIQSDLPGVRITDDGHFGSGLADTTRPTPHVKKPIVTVRAGADLFLVRSK